MLLNVQYICYIFSVYFGFGNCKIVECTVKVIYSNSFTVQCKFYEDQLADCLPAILP